MRITLTTAIYFCLMPLLFGQGLNNDLITDAKKAYESAAYQKAYDLYNQAKAEAKSSADQKTVIDCSIGITRCQLALGQFATRMGNFADRDAGRVHKC